MPPPPLTRPERALRGVLRLNGAITCCALLAAVMPLTWMHDIHHRLALGPVPQGPVFEYLARTVSFIYFVHGVLCLRLAADVRRFGPIITTVAACELAFAAAVIAIDHAAGLPPIWTAIESTLVTLFGGTILTLRLRAPAVANE